MARTYPEGGGDEGLASEPRVNTHEEDDVYFVHHILAVVKTRRWRED